MIYQFFKLPFIILMFSFYRRIYWANSERMPKDIPMIIIANHSTAFVEQVLVASMLRRGVYFWAKASIFTNPVAKWFYRQLHILSIIRAEDGLKNRHQNQDTFEQTYEHLLSGKAVFIAPEGNSVMEKRLRHFRTGTARVALGAAAKTNFEQKIAILPIGVNYTHHRNWRADVMVSFGEPLWVGDFQEDYEKDPHRAAKIFTQAMYTALRKEVIHINLEEDGKLVEACYRLYRNEQISAVGPCFSKDGARLRQEQLITQTLNELEPSKKTNLEAACSNYFGCLAELNLEDEMLAPQQQLNFEQKIVLYLGAIPALLGCMAGLLPLTIARRLRKKIIHKPKNQHFWAPIAMVLALLSWIGYTTLLSLASCYWLSFWSLTLGPIAAALQFWQIRHADYLLVWQRENRLRQFAKDAPQELKLLRKERASLMEQCAPIFRFSSKKD